MTTGTGTTADAHDEPNRPITIARPGPKAVGYRYGRGGNGSEPFDPESTAVGSSFDQARPVVSTLDWPNRATTS